MQWPIAHAVLHVHTNFLEVLFVDMVALSRLS